MAPFVLPGTELRLLKGYYETHEAQRHDVVAYRYRGREWPLMKIVYGVPGDRWELRDQGGYYNLILNGRVLRNVPGREYRFLKSLSKRLVRYSRIYPVIPKDAYLIFGNEPGGSLDSTTFGLVHRSDFAGRLVLKASSAKEKPEAGRSQE